MGALGNQRGFSLPEILIIAAIIGVISGIAIPAMTSALERNRLRGGADIMAGQLRAARLAAITRNASFRVAFDCPTAGTVRVLAVTGDAAIDDAVDRCSNTIANDGPTALVPPTITYGAPPTITFNGRGQASTGGALPLTIAVSHGAITRNVVVSATGRVQITGG
jgi:type IV fimbrial biogenesis protein FimT